MGGDREISTMTAHDFDIAAVARDVAGHQFGNDPIGNVAQFKAIAVANNQQQADDSPKKRGLDRLRQSFPKQHQHQAADKDDKHDFEGERADVVAQKIGDGILVPAGDQRGQR